MAAMVKTAVFCLMVAAGAVHGGENVVTLPGSGTVVGTVECDPDSIRVTMTVTMDDPNTPFAGIIYSHDDKANCEFTNKQQKDVSYTDSNCAPAQKDDKGVTIHTIDIKVRFSKKVVLSSDVLYTATCRINNLVQVDANFKINTEASSVKNGMEESGDAATDTAVGRTVVMSLTKDGRAATNVALGEDLALLVTLDTSGLFKTMSVPRCFAHNNSDTAATYLSTLELVDDGCRPDSAAPVAEEVSWLTSKVDMSQTVQAFTFISESGSPGTMLYITCKIDLCDSEDPCEQALCDDGAVKRRRRKRSVSGNGTSHNIMLQTATYVSFTKFEKKETKVNNGVTTSLEGSSSAKGGHAPASVSTCLVNGPLQNLFYALGITIVVLLFTLGGLTTWVACCKGNRASASDTQSLSTNDGQLTPGVSALALTNPRFRREKEFPFYPRFEKK